jgi:hypothetical protein
LALTPDRRIEGQRLDVALRETARRATDQVTRAQVEAFEALLRTRYRGRSFGEARSLHEELASFTMPCIADPGIFQSARYLDLLDQVLGEVLPRLPVDEEVKAIAAAIIEEVAEGHRDLQDRIATADA